MSWNGEIAPATIEQVRAGRGGKMHVLTEDAGGVAEGLRHLDSRLALRYSESGGYYCVYAREPHMQEGEGWLVKTYEECDQRIVKDVEKILHRWNQPGFSFADEMDKAQAAAEKAKDDEFKERIAEKAEHLAWALRGELGANDHRIFVPGDPDE